MSVAVVVNPRAGGGRMGRLWPRIEAALRARMGALTVAQTTATATAIGLARAFAADGVGLIVAAGGDGTVSEVVDGIMQGAGHRPDLGIIPVGTGTDLARGLCIRGEAVAEHIDRLANGGGRRLDIGRIAFRADGGGVAIRHFINIASLGLSGPTDRAVNAAKQRPGTPGKAVFLWHTIMQLLRYRLQDVRIAIDDAEPIDARIAVVAIANGQFFGGGMMIAPDAKPDDGMFDIVIFRGASKLRLIADLRLLYGGGHRQHPQVTIARGKTVTVTPLGDPEANAALLDIDGESPGSIPARFDLLPAALLVRC